MSEPIQTKRCSKCKTIKNISDFTKSSFSKDGFECWCKQCKRAKDKEYRATPQGKETKRRYQHSPKGIEVRRKAMKKYSLKYRALHDNKLKARMAINNAVHTGKFPPANSHQCKHCDNSATEYHHHSYDKEKWFDVLPLCTKCHKLLHRKASS